MLEYRRPLNTDSLDRFCSRFVASLPGAYVDTWGNYLVNVGNESRILWSSHTDTVHTTGGSQTLRIDGDTVTLSKRSKKHGSNCLGGDCTVGVWLMRNMILGGVAGHYIFHYGEERGGIGSKAIAENHADWIAESFDYCIAFDRRGNDSIITHQSSWRTASDKFAESMIAALATAGLSGYEPDDSGSYTDSYEYAEIIPECTNVSVGYDHEHRQSESVDLAHAERLLAAMLRLDVSALVKDRDPNDPANVVVYDWRKSTSATDWATWRDTYGNSGAYERDYRPYDNGGEYVYTSCIGCGSIMLCDPDSFICDDCADDGLDPNDVPPADYDDESDRRTPSERYADRAYLDPVYAEVQRDLLEMLARQRNGKK